jgi:hypothetical protein
MSSFLRFWQSLVLEKKVDWFGIKKQSCKRLIMKRIKRNTGEKQKKDLKSCLIIKKKIFLCSLNERLMSSFCGLYEFFLCVCSVVITLCDK